MEPETISKNGVSSKSQMSRVIFSFIVAVMTIACDKNVPIDETVAVTNVTLSKTTTTLHVGDTLTLFATVLPDNADDKSVTWMSNNTTIATVNGGLITAKALGTTTITATTQNGGKIATCTVTVIEPLAIMVSNPQALAQTVYADETQGVSLNFTTTGAWSSSTAASWISITPTSGNNAGNYTSSFTLATNPTGADRSATITITCKGEEVTINIMQKAVKRDGNPYEPNVYVAGYEGNYAKLWKNGVAQNLTDGFSSASANSVYVLGGDVYVAGHEGNYAKLWKNGIAQNLTDGTYEAKANYVYVDSNDVYVAGYEYITQNHPVAKLWKNGVAQTIASGNNGAMANYVTLVGNDVYVGGWEYVLGNNYARVWKNGEIVQEIYYRYGNSSTCVSNSGDIYMAVTSSDGNGNYYGNWYKNGVPQHSSSVRYWREANSIFLSGHDVYIAGNNYIISYGNAPILWKNNAQQELATYMFMASANSVFIFGNDVYTTGYTWQSSSSGGSIAKVWKNGVEQSLTNGSNAARGLCIFVR